MKKNFVKKSLATTLALAMVATTMPAALTTASAAKAPTFNKTAKYLYINENEVGNEFDLNINNKLKGWKYQWSTSNKEVATVGAYGMVRPGTKTGVANIYCKITFKNKNTKTLKARITVKENATKVWASNLPEENTVTVGADVYDFNSAFESASGARPTDYRMWEISEEGNTAKATIDKKTGVLSTETAGTFKVRVRAYQSLAKLAANETVDSDWYEIKVAPQLVEVKQASTNTLSVTFNDNMKDKVKATDFTIENDTTKSAHQVKDITFSEDGKTVTVSSFADYTDNGKYTLTYNKKDFEFTTTIGEVADILITPATAEVNKETELKFTLLNAEGVDITSVKGNALTTEDSENNDGWYDSTSKKITMYKVGATAKITATYHTYKFNPDGTEQGIVKKDAVITCVDKAPTNITTKYTISSDDVAPDFSKLTEVNSMVAVNDESMALYIQLADNGTAVADAEYANYTVESGNENVLLVGALTDKKVSIVGVTEGSTVVILKDSQGKVVATFPVVVKGTRKAATVSLDRAGVTLTTNADSDLLNKTTVKATVKDQYAKELGGQSVTTEMLTKIDESKVSAPTVSATGTDITVDAKGATAGSYSFLVKCGDAKSVLAVVVKTAPDKGSEAYRLDVDKLTEDAKIDGSGKEKDITIKAVKTVGGVDKDVLASGTTEGTVTFTLEDKDGKDVTNKLTLNADSSVSLKVVSKDASGMFAKLAAGAYRLTMTVNGVDGKDIAVRKQVITITDTQAPVTCLVTKLTGLATDYSNLLELCKFSYNGKTYTSADSTLINVTVDEADVVKVPNSDTKVFIKAATVEITDGDAKFSVKVTINKTFSK